MNPTDTQAQAEWAWFILIRAVQQPPRERLPEPAQSIFRVIERLYQQRRLERDELTILRRWGERGYPPPAEERGEYRIWLEAMSKIDAALRKQGIIH